MRGALLILLGLAWAAGLGFLLFGSGEKASGIGIASPVWLPAPVRWPATIFIVVIILFGWIVPLGLGIGSVIGRRD